MYLGNYYEVETDGSSTTTRRYYYAGAVRVAMRENDTLFYLLSDHPAPRMGGGTNITTDAAGNKVAEMRYKAYGETRYNEGNTPTNFHYPPKNGGGRPTRSRSRPVLLQRALLRPGAEPLGSA